MNVKSRETATRLQTRRWRFFLAAPGFETMKHLAWNGDFFRGFSWNAGSEHLLGYV